MSPEIPPPDFVEFTEPEPPAPQYPFWGYLDLAAFLMIALVGLIVTSLLAHVALSVTHTKEIFLALPAQFLLYAILLSALAFIFRRYYGQPFWASLRWIPSGVSVQFTALCGIALAVAVIGGSVLLRTPDINSPMKELLSDKTSLILVAIAGSTIAPVCEELLFRGFLQPLLVQSFGAVGGILLTALPFGLLHLEEYGNSWRHALLIGMAGAAFGWMRHRTGSTRAAALMHAIYNGFFFALLVVPQPSSSVAMR